MGALGLGKMRRLVCGHTGVCEVCGGEFFYKLCVQCLDVQNVHMCHIFSVVGRNERLCSSYDQ